MRDDNMRTSVGRFVKKVNFTTQREIEKAIRNAVASGKLKGHETFTAGVKLTSEKVGLELTIYSTIELA
jgi:uncharacterized protein DUF6494